MEFKENTRFKFLNLGMIKKTNLLYVALIAAFVSCVPARLLDESKAKLNECETERSALKKATQENDAKIAELKEQMTKNEKENLGLRRDTSIIGSNYRNLTSKYDKLNQLNEQLMDRLNKLLSGSEKDNSKLSGDLQMTQEQLLKKQDELKALEAKLLLQRLDLDALSA